MGCGSRFESIQLAVTWWSERPVFCLLVGLIGGCLLGVAVPLSLGLIITFLIAITLLWGPWPVWPNPALPLRSCARLGLAGLLLTHLHLTWQHHALPLDHIAHTLSDIARQRITVEGQLYRPVDSRRDRQYVYLQLHRFYHKDTWQPVSGRARLKIHTTQLDFWPGDHIRIERVRLHPVRNFQNPGAFDFKAFMHQQGIYAIGGVTRAHHLSLLKRPTGWQVTRSVAQWRQSVGHQVRPLLPDPIEPLFFAMVLGQKGPLTPDIQDAFRTAGAAHLLVVSGLHVGFVMLGFFATIRFVLRPIRSGLPRTWLPAWRPTPLAALLCLPPVLLYCTLVGWKVSTIRAALMVGSSMLALAISRPRDVPYALGLAAALILILDPNALFSLGFQLSFTAVGTIVLMAQRITATEPTAPSDQLATTWAQKFWAGGLTSSAAFIGTAPILATAFHTLPTYSILTNLVLVPLAGLIVPVGVIALGLSLIAPPLASALFAVLAWPLSWLPPLLTAVGNWPAAQLYVPAPSLMVSVAYYSLLASAFLTCSRRLRRVLVSTCTLLLVSSLGWQYSSAQPQQLRITFLDVGTGDAILIETPERQRILIDGGGTYNGRFDIGTQVVAPVLWQRFIRRLDLMVMTHTHPNHARGLVSLFRLFPTSHILTNGSPFKAKYLRNFNQLRQQRGTPLHTAQTGPRRWRWGQLTLTVLSPPPHASPRLATWQPPTENDRSVVLLLQYGNFRMLFTGDIQHDTEQWLTQHIEELNVDVLQIAHHGSRTSTHPAFIKHTQPETAIISAGSGNPYGHPHPIVLETLNQANLKIFRTDRHGAITVTTDGQQYHIATLRADLPTHPIHISP